MGTRTCVGGSGGTNLSLAASLRNQAGTASGIGCLWLPDARPQAALPANAVSSLSVEDDPVLKVWVDKANHEVVIEVGPFHVPAKAPGASAEDHMASMHD